MGHPGTFKSVKKRLSHMLLTHKLIKRLRTPFSGENLISQVDTSPEVRKTGQPTSHTVPSYRCFLSDLAGLACWRFATSGLGKIPQMMRFAILKSERLAVRHSTRRDMMDATSAAVRDSKVAPSPEATAAGDGERNGRAGARSSRRPPASAPSRLAEAERDGAPNGRFCHQNRHLQIPP